MTGRALLRKWYSRKKSVTKKIGGGTAAPIPS